MIIYTAFWFAISIIGFIAEDESPGQSFFAILVFLPIFGRVFGWW